MNTSEPEILFKKFKIVSCFKKNEHTAVYLADHVFLEKKVFLKILNTETIPDSSITERFKREAKILAQLEHPNIIKVFDFGMFEEFFYISFEYFESNNLREFLNKNSVSDEVKKSIFIQLVRGLNAAHHKEVIHRDIKPENILVDNDHLVKLTDFGLAQDSIDNLITQQYSVVGTPAYMSPEQIQGNQLSKQSDLFSLGITALELFKGSNPFLGKDPNETINNILSFDENEQSAIFEDLDENLSKVIKGLLVSNPSDRFNSCKEILEIFNITIEQKEFSHKKKKSILLPFALSLVIISILTIIFYYFSDIDNSDKIIPEITDSVKTDFVEKTESIVQIDESQNDLPVEVTEKDKIENIAEKDTEENILQKEESPEISLGELFIKCYPWAKVYLNNNFIETTPLSKNISKDEGKYLLTLEHPNYPKYTDSIVVRNSELLYIEVNLDTLFGYVNCQVYPWGDVYINEEKIGTTPLQKSIKLTPGNYSILLKNPKYKNLEKRIVVIRNDTLKLNFNLENGKIN